MIYRHEGSMLHNFRSVHSNRRRFMLATAIAAAVLSAPCFAQPAAGRPLRIVVGYPAGQTVDLVARHLAPALARELGRPVYVDNKAGANGIIGASDVKAAAPDGNTLLLGTSGQIAINPTLYKSLPYDPRADFIPVTMVFSAPLYLVASPQFPANDFQQLLALAKARPGELNFGSGGQGITAHLAMELLQKQAGIRLTHVPYKGSPAAITDLIAGRIQLMFEPGASAMPYITSGKLKALGVTSAERDPMNSAVATIQEQGMKDFEVNAWNAMFLPKGTPQTSADQLNAALRKVLGTAELQGSLQKLGLKPLSSTIEETRRYVGAEIVKWGDAVKASGVKLD